MLNDTIVDLLRQMLWISLLLAGPVLLTALVVGLVIGLLQAVTSIQEQTLTFVPKIVALALVLALLGGWMLRMLISYSAEMLGNLPKWGAL
ncbi:MAG TPA: flagellar biosynthetic protein FliQ [Planctomycetes bacterium]|nr:flagellar biosynthetic protein FliQ [Planctomycetota bacterium]